MTNRVLVVFALLTALAGVALAADVSGKWTAQVPGREGQTRETVFTFKVDGDKLTGSTTGRQGQEMPIADGKISGDTLSFTVTTRMGDNEMKWTYTGKVAGNEIQFKREGGQGQPREFKATRVP